MFTLQLAGVCVAVLAAAAIAVYALRTPPSKHGRRRGVRHGLPTEIRRHRRTTRDHTWAGTRSSRVVAPSTLHALDALDTTAERRRYVVANLIEATGEITRTDLEAILGPTAERRRYVVANLIEETGEITSTDLATLLGSRPAELVTA